MAEYKKRESFENRLKSIDESTFEYYKQIKGKLLSYTNVKSRVSLRCDSFRQNGKLIAKLALGGKSLKVYLAIDINDDVFSITKSHPRDLSLTKAYEEVPTMIPVKSNLAVKKVMCIIEKMMA